MRIPTIPVLMCLLAIPAWAQETQMTCIEQEVVRERVAGQPALKGAQRICFTEKRIRNEVRFGEKRSVALFDLEAGRVAVIPGALPEYVELLLADYRHLLQMRLKGSGLNDPEGTPSLTKTDQTRQIGAWNCRKVVFEQTGRMVIRTELWIAQDAQLDFQAWVALMDRLGLLEALGRLGQFARQLQGMPIELRAEQIISDQKLVTSLRVLRISQEPVSVETFQVPPGYERIEAGPIPGNEEPGPPTQTDEPPAAQGG